MRVCSSLLLAISLSVAASAAAQTSPNDAMQTCKNTASDRMPNVPRAFISVQRGSDTGNGSYMINFRADQAHRSGFCIISKRGRLQNFQFDAPLPPPSTQNFGGQTPLEAMRSCKSTVSSRYPDIPLAYIQVDNPSVNGGSLLSNFRVQPPNGRRITGSCDIFKNGRVNLTIR